MDKHAVLARYFGYSAFRPGQEAVIDAILARRDTFAVMPTGAGKSLCYQIPALLLDGVTIVISPLISLMKDQVNALSAAGVSAACLNSSLAPDEYADTVYHARQGAYKLLYIAPERLQRADAKRLAGSLAVSMVVIDEAHCVSQWGHDFRPSYLLIPGFTASFPQPPVIAAFTATATGKVRADIASLLKLQKPFTIVTGFNRENLYFEVRRPRDKTREVFDLLERWRGKSGIIYCSTRKAVEELCAALNERGILAARYHAGLDARERHLNQDDFIYDRKPLIVATNAFGMGIDKSNVSFVIHYNMPKNIESYYQEAGRAGRDGSPAWCVLLYSPKDVRLNTFLIERSQEEAEETADDAQLARNLELLKQMTFYATTDDCLRGRLLSYFGESVPPVCGNCGNCAAGTECVDITIAAQKICSCVYRMEKHSGAYGRTMIINVLRGSKTEKIHRTGLDTLSTYGIMKEVSAADARAILDHLIAEGFLVLIEGDYPVVRQTERTREVLFERTPLSMTRLVARKPEAPPASRSRREWRGGPGGGEDDADIDEALFEKLRGLRGRLAREAGVPVYVIFPDASLRDMCRRLPETGAEFRLISGVGDVKAQKYAGPFTGLISEHLAALRDMPPP